ncbi:hypothetical protein GIB67_038386 [Kingdonia uniflora]|uniref:Multifunctional fusion protein n=1 Tax=Kingdonia uniflora TaxID=39325 RepID=A0A7J7NNY8_9MAGN|nr:hypothetical protein GIB67_038386 [Kingdonia uniflora]
MESNNNSNNYQDPLDPQSDHSSDQFSQPQPQQPTQQQRRPRGFAARAASLSAAGVASVSSQRGTGRREREKEKERTKLRERHRRSITSRMLAGLRQYGNFTLPARADMNDVLAALARNAGWTVEPDGTTYRPSVPQQQQQQQQQNYQAPYHVRTIESPLSTASLKNGAHKASVDCQPSILGIDENFSPTSLGSGIVAEREPMIENFPSGSPINSSECIEADQLIQSSHPEQNGNDFSGTPYIPVYVILAFHSSFASYETLKCFVVQQAGIINNFCQLVDPLGIREEFAYLKSLNVDGVVVTCWWGIVECWSSQKYIWSGYRDLFNISREFKMKLQVTSY